MEEYIENERFNAAKEKIIGKKHNDKGIGTLSEKTVHGVLKHFFEPDEDCHEVALNGYFADIYNDSGVIEIQTRQFNKLREKLAVFLNYYPVTVVYPMPANKWLSWINPETGETGGRRKSPRHFTIYDSFFELYKIKSYLKNPNLTIKLVLMDVEEYKLLNGWDNSKKRGAWRYDRIPVGIREIVVLEQPEDYMQFVPYELEDGFTSKDFARVCRINKSTAGLALNILNYMGMVKRRRMFEMKKNEDGIGTFFRKMQGSYIVMAVAYVVFGLSLLIKPELSTTVICYAIGAVCVIYAVANLIKYFTGSMNRMYIEPDFVLSVIICVFGIVTIVRPSVIISILPFIVGIVLVFSGLIKVQDGINLKRFNYDRWFLVLGFAVISVILGIVVLLNPFGTGLLFTRMVGLFFTVDGVLSISSIVMLRKNGKFY